MKIERDEITKTYYEEVIDAFASIRTRKVLF